MSDPDVSNLVVVELPSLGADMDYGTVLQWRVSPGDSVHRGDVVALVSTEKSDIDVEIWQSGVVAELLIDVGREVPVGTPMLKLRVDAGDTATESMPQAPTPATPTPAPTPAPAPAPTPTPATPAPTPAPSPSSAGTAGASPLARTRASELGIDLAAITGTGPDGAVMIADVEVAASASVPVVDRATGMRRAIAERMARANRDIPHYHLEVDIDMGRPLAWLAAHNEHRSVADRVLPAALFVQATARAAAEHGECNGYWVDGGFEPCERVDVGIAISLRRGGLVTPVIAGADQRSLDEIMADIKELVTGARAAALRSGRMIDASITLTNLGDNGAPRVHGVIFPPQVALVGVGGIVRRAWVVDDAVVARPIVTVSFAGDHRATDGAVGSRFLATFANHLEQLEEP